MSRRLWTGVVAGVLAAAVVVSVALGAYRAGQRSDVATRTVTDGTEVVRVIDGHGWGWGYGPGPGFVLVPLLAILLVLLLLRGGRRWDGGADGGWCRGETFDERHRRAHGPADQPEDRAVT
jgi:putative membrane protein